MLSERIDDWQENWKREGLEQGLEQGIEQGAIEKAREDVIDVLKIKFSNAPESIVSAVNKSVDPVRLKAMHHEAIRSDSLASFEQWMNE